MVSGSCGGFLMGYGGIIGEVEVMWCEGCEEDCVGKFVDSLEVGLVEEEDVDDVDKDGEFIGKRFTLICFGRLVSLIFFFILL